MGFLSNKKTFGLALISVAAVLIVAFYIIGSINLGPTISSDSTNTRQDKIISLENKNITQELLGSVLQEVAAANIDSGTGSNDSIAIPSNSTIDQLVSDSLDDFDLSVYKPTIDNNNIIISSDNSPEALTRYFQNFQNIISKSASEGNVITSYSDVEDVFNIMEDTYQTSLRNFYNLKTPSKLVDIHKEEISLLLGKIFVSQQIKQYEADPLKAMQALEADEYLNKEFELLKIKVNKFITDNNIVI